MKRIIILMLVLAPLFFSCQNFEKKVKHDLKKADSLTNIAIDSIRGQITGQVDTPNVELTTTTKQANIATEDDLIFAYTNILRALKANDQTFAADFLFMRDSVLVIKTQGIFRILTLESFNSLFDTYFQPEDSAWSCKLTFKEFPQLVDTTWSEKGCFAEPLKDFAKFSAILEIEKETNIPVSPLLEHKVAQAEKYVNYQILNTYLGWIFYFAAKDGKYFLVGVDLNQY